MNGIDPEFQRILLRVVLVGGTIMIAGATGLFFAFRAFAPSAKKGSDFRAVVAIISVLAVVMIGCFILLIFSYAKR
jgi:nitrate reductase gamma subunit